MRPSLLSRWLWGSSGGPQGPCCSKCAPPDHQRKLLLRTAGNGDNQTALLRWCGFPSNMLQARQLIVVLAIAVVAGVVSFQFGRSRVHVQLRSECEPRERSAASTHTPTGALRAELTASPVAVSRDVSLLSTSSLSLACPRVLMPAVEHSAAIGLRFAALAVAMVEANDTQSMLVVDEGFFGAAAGYGWCGRLSGWREAGLWRQCRRLLGWQDRRPLRGARSGWRR
jgi:hypothetical protein